MHHPPPITHHPPPPPRNPLTQFARVPDPFETNRKSTVGVPLAGLVVEEPALGPAHAPARHVLQRHRRRVRNVVGEVQAGDLWA